MSPSVSRKSPMRRYSVRRSLSPVRDHGSPPRGRERSPVASTCRSRNSPCRERSPGHHKSIGYRDNGGSPVKEKRSSTAKSPKRDKLSSSVSRSPSPRNKQLRRAQAEKEAERFLERGRDDGKGSSKFKHDRDGRKEKELEEVPKERIERRSERDRDGGSGQEKDRARDMSRDRERRSERDVGSVKERDTNRERRSVRDGGHIRGRNGESETSRDRVADLASSRSRHWRSESPSGGHHNSRRHHSRSPPPASRAGARDEDDNSVRTERRDEANDSVAMMEAAEQALETKEKQKPSFELSGKLADETNRVRGITLLFNEPPDAHKPDIRWRLYVFKGGEVLNEPLYVHRQSCYLFGRERRIADIPTDHPSCSKQHAVLQYRQVDKEQPDGMMAKQVRPYLMDLGSTNKTFINDKAIEPQRYYELLEKDTIRFGNSSREYVLLHENSLS